MSLVDQVTYRFGRSLNALLMSVFTEQARGQTVDGRKRAMPYSAINGTAILSSLPAKLGGQPGRGRWEGSACGGLLSNSGF